MPGDPATSTSSLLWPIIALATGAVALVAVCWAGCLRRDALAKGPPRASDLTGGDLLTGLGLMILGMIAASALIRWLTGGQGMSEQPALTLAGLVLLNQVLGQGLPTAYLVVRAVSAPKGLSELGLWPPRGWRDARATLLGLVVSLPIVFAVLVLGGLVSSWLGLPQREVGHTLLKTFRDSDSLAGLLVLGAAATVVAAMLEEAIYRGLVQSALLQMFGAHRRWWIVLGTAALFASRHMGPATFDPEAEAGVTAAALLGLFVFGVILGWLYERTGSLWPGIGVHAGFNLVNIVAVVATMR